MRTQRLPGYITEKIFDCFIAGVVPVYLGWDGAGRFIPKTPSSINDTIPIMNPSTTISPTWAKRIQRLPRRHRRFLSSEKAKLFDVSFLWKPSLKDGLKQPPAESDEP
jgi:hypothetical protein